MSTRETQKLIKATALSLFNARGTARVSTNAIAAQCGISKGNLHYHYRTKQEIVHAMFQDIVAEMDAGWYEDIRQPTITHVAEMFARQLEIIWRYRFFYREMAALTSQSQDLQRSLRESRNRRIAALVDFFETLVAAGVLAGPHSRHSLRHLVIMTWIFSDNWLNFIEIQGDQRDREVVHQGYDMIIEVLYPYLTERAREEIYRSYTAIRAEFLEA